MSGAGTLFLIILGVLIAIINALIFRPLRQKNYEKDFKADFKSQEKIKSSTDDILNTIAKKNKDILIEGEIVNHDVIMNSGTFVDRVAYSHEGDDDCKNISGLMDIIITKIPHLEDKLISKTFSNQNKNPDYTNIHDDFNMQNKSNEELYNILKSQKGEWRPEVIENVKKILNARNLSELTKNENKIGAGRKVRLVLSKNQANKGYGFELNSHFLIKGRLLMKTQEQEIKEILRNSEPLFYRTKEKNILNPSYNKNIDYLFFAT